MNLKSLLLTLLIFCLMVTSLSTAYAFQIEDFDFKVEAISKSKDINIASTVSESNNKLPTNVEKIDVKSDTWIQITFNQSIKPIKPSNIKIYEKVKRSPLKFTVSIISDTEVRLRTDSQRPKTKYTIELTNIINSKGSVVKKITASFLGYENTGIKSDLFKISKVEQISNNKLVVYFTNPINTNAEQPTVFSLLNGEKVLVKGSASKIAVKKVEDKPNALSLYFNEYTFKSDIEYTLKVNGSLFSVYGTYLGQEAGDQINFIGKTLEEEPFRLLNVTSLNKKSIQLNFNKLVSQSDAKQISKYNIKKIGTNETIRLMNAIVVNNNYGNGCGVILNSINSFNLASYNVTISNINDATKQELIKIQKYSFKANKDTVDTIKVVSVVPIDLNCIEIKFNKNLDPVIAEDVENYFILKPYKYEIAEPSKETGNIRKLVPVSHLEQPIKVVYSSDSPDSVKLYFWYDSPMLPFSKCILSISKDLHTGEKLSNKIEYEFTANNILKKAIEVKSAITLSDNIVKINFNSEIAPYGHNILLQNYSINNINDGTIQVPLAVTYFDKNTVVLKFSKIDLTKPYDLVYYRLVDITGETYSGKNIKITQGK